MYDDLDKMRKRMNLFEMSKRQIDNTLKELIRNQPIKKARLDNNFLSPTPETINEGIQGRALIALKPGTASAVSNRK